MNRDNLKAQIDAAVASNPLAQYTTLIGCTHDTQEGNDYCFHPTWWREAGSIKVVPKDNKWVSNAADHSGGDHYNLYAIRERLDCKTDFPKILRGVADCLGIAYDLHEHPPEGPPGKRKATPAEVADVKVSQKSNNATFDLDAVCKNIRDWSQEQRHRPIGEIATDRKADAYWTYRDIDVNGNEYIYGAVLRHNSISPEGKPGKDIIPWRYDTERGWRLEGFKKPHMLYNLHLLKRNPEALVWINEGEKSADGCTDKIPDGEIAISLHGGAKRVRNADSKPLRGRVAIVVADNDSPGLNAMRVTAAKAALEGASVSTISNLPPEFPEKWDMGDPWPDGWNIERFRELAQPWAITDDVQAEHDARSEMFSDAWCAKEFAARADGKLLYNIDRDAWHAWDGMRWARRADGRVMAMAKKNALAIRGNSGALAIESYQQNMLRKLESKERLNATITLAKSEATLEASNKDFDSDPWLLNCGNGTLDLRTGELSEHDPSQRITALVNADYDPDAKAPRWEQFMHEFCCGDLQLERYLQMAAGYSLSGDMDEQFFFVLLSPTASNGKSVFLNTLQAILNDYAIAASSETFTHASNANARSGTREDIIALDGKRFCYAGELAEGSAWAESLIKKWTGGESMSVEQKYGKLLTFDPVGKLWFSTNKMPRAMSSDNGFWRRLQVVPCNNHVTYEEREKGLKDRLFTESDGILAWCVRGCLEWQQHGLQSPAAVDIATAKVRGESDTVAGFIYRCCTTGGPELQTPAREFYAEYTKFCHQEGRTPLTETLFGKNLDFKGHIGKRKSTGNVRLGVKLSTFQAQEIDCAF